MQNNRDTTLDMIKGGLILLVVLGHSIQYGYGQEYLQNQLYLDNLCYKFIYTFHMPLFALISGYFFEKSNHRTLCEVINRKIRGIFIPLLVFTLIVFIFLYHSYISHNNVLFVIGEFFKLLIGWPFWFLGSIFFESLIIGGISRITNKEVLNESLIISIIFASFFIPDSIILNCHKFVFPFFYLGYLLSSKGVSLCNSYINEKHKSVELLLLGILSFILIYFYRKEYFVGVSGAYILEYPNMPWIIIYRVFTGVIVSRFICLIAPFFIKSKLLSRFGRETLGIYCFQGLIFLAMPSVLSQVSIRNSLIPFTPLIVFLFVLTVASFCVLCTNKLIPWILGKY